MRPRRTHYHSHIRLSVRKFALATRQLSLVPDAAGGERLLTVDLLMGGNAEGLVDFLEARWKRRRVSKTG